MSSFGRCFRVTTFGESHCKGVGAIVDGVPPRMLLKESDIQPQLTRRRPGQSKISTPRNEADAVQILSGTEYGITLGTPIGLFVKNLDHRPQDYKEMTDIPRPSHADLTYQLKYGIRASSGGGRSSARETIGRVAAGAIAEKWLKEAYGTNIVAYTSRIGEVAVPLELEETFLDRATVDSNIVRCPHQETAEKMIKIIEETRDAKDSIGGVVTCVVRNVPAGLGEPCFDKLEALLAHAMLSIPATKGFEIGSGFEGVKLRGSQHNDPFVQKSANFRGIGGVQVDSYLGTETNRSGGIQGGITNTENIVFRVAFKSPATICKPQNTADYTGADSVLDAKGRHDPCVVPRAIAIVEAMTALVLADAALIQESRVGASRHYVEVAKASDKARETLENSDFAKKLKEETQEPQAKKQKCDSK